MTEALPCSRCRSDRQAGQGDVVYPIGYSEKPVPDTSIQETDKNLVEKVSLYEEAVRFLGFFSVGGLLTVLPLVLPAMLGCRPGPSQTDPHESVHHVHVGEHHLHLPYHDGVHDGLEAHTGSDVNVSQ